MHKAKMTKAKKKKICIQNYFKLNYYVKLI